MNKTAVQVLALGMCFAFLMGCSRSKTPTGIGSRPEATLDEVNQALGTWSLYYGSYPSNLVQLEAAPFFKKRLPTPPPGQKLVLDRNGQVEYVNE